MATEQDPAEVAAQQLQQEQADIMAQRMRDAYQNNPLKNVSPSQVFQAKGLPPLKGGPFEQRNPTKGGVDKSN